MVVPNGVAMVWGIGCGCAEQAAPSSSDANRGLDSAESNTRPALAAPAEDQRKLRREILMGVLPAKKIGCSIGRNPALCLGDLNRNVRFRKGLPQDVRCTPEIWLRSLHPSESNINRSLRQR